MRATVEGVRNSVSNLYYYSNIGTYVRVVIQTTTSRRRNLDLFLPSIRSEFGGWPCLVSRAIGDTRLHQVEIDANA